MHNLIRGSHMGTATTQNTTPTNSDKPKPHPSARSTTTTVAGGGGGGKTDSAKSNVGRNNKGPSQEQIARAKEKREAVLRQIRHEKRVMLVAAAAAALAATPLWIIAIATTHWYSVEADLSLIQVPTSTTTAASTIAAAAVLQTSTVLPIFVTSNESLSREELIEYPEGRVDEEYLVESTTGLFRTCRTTTADAANNNGPLLSSKTREECGYLALFPSREELYNDPAIDQHVVDYVRTSLLFAFVSLLVMVMALLSAFYTFKNSRYMYKRLAAGLFFIAAGCVLVVVEVVVTLVRYSSSNLAWAHPPGSSYSYGFSFYLGWFVFATYLANGALFLVLSRKHKSSHEAGDDDQQFFGR